MKYSATKIANAFALTMSILWVLCSAVVWLFPKFSLLVTKWWMHGMNLSVMGSWHLNVGNFLLGGITAVVSAWVTGLVLGWSLVKAEDNSRRK